MTATKSAFQRGLLASAIGLITFDTAIAESFSLEEVVVTATRRAETVQDIPYNISAMTGDTLAKQGITDMSKLARNITGLTLVDKGGRDNGASSGLIMRGLNADATSGTGDGAALTPNTVSTYVDDVPVFYNIHMKDIDRVEVLRGPQGTLYGSGSLGGTIRYIYNKPDTEAFSMEAGSRLSSTEGSSGLNTDTHTVINIPLADNMALRTVFGYVENQGFIDQTSMVSTDATGNVIADTNQGLASSADTPPLYRSSKDTNNERTKHFRLSYLWDINESTSTTLTYHHQEDSYGGRQAVNFNHPDGGDNKSTLAQKESLDRELDVYSWDMEMDLGFAAFSSNVSYYETESHSLGDLNATYLNAGFSYLDPSDGYGINQISLRPHFLADYTEEQQGTSVELRLASNGDGPIDYVVGLFYLERQYEAEQHDKLLGYWEATHPTLKTEVYDATNRPAPLTKDDIYLQVTDDTFTDKAVFGEVTYHINDRWQVTAGMRAFDQTFDASNDIYLPEGGILNSTVGDIRGLVPTGSKEDFKDEIFKLNTSYDLTGDVMVYFTWAEGFRHGGVNRIPTSDQVNNIYIAEDPEFGKYKSDKAENWELGIKGSAMEDRLSFSAAMFQIDWQDVQIQGETPNLFYPAVLNGDTATSRGVELEVKYAVTQNLQVTLGYAYTNAELTNDFTIGGETIGRDGDNLPGVPENTANLGVNYVSSLSNGMDLSYNLSGAFVDSVQNGLNKDSSDYSEDPSHSLWGVSVALDAEQWGISLFVDNVFDEQARYGSSGPSDNVVSPDGFTRPGYQLNRDLATFVNRPRTAGVDVYYRF